MLNKPHRLIGKILRTYREKTGRHQAQIAAEAGISTSMLSQIERGGVSPSIDTLVDVCRALELDMAELFGWVSSHKKVRISHPGQRLKTQKGGVCYEQLASSQDNSHPAETFLIEIEPGTQVGISGKGHEGVEMGYIFSGTAVLTVDGLEYPIEEGDSVTFSSHLPHRVVNDGPTLFRAVWCVLPPHKDYLDLPELVGSGEPGAPGAAVSPPAPGKS